MGLLQGRNHRAGENRIHLILSALFGLTALVYASVGFGGGSTYIALLAISGADYRMIPIVALSCNLCVVAGGVMRFAAAGHLDILKILPLVIVSAPMAWAGGSLIVSEALFLGLLGWTLLAASLLTWRGGALDRSPIVKGGKTALLLASGGVGFLSGLVGIGGGIFLSPLLHIARWAKPKEIAGTAALFIFVNSAAGLIGQVGKGSGAIYGEALGFAPLLIAVIVGGQIGALWGARRAAQARLRKITAALVFLVSLRLLWRWGGLIGISAL